MTRSTSLRKIALALPTGQEPPAGTGEHDRLVLRQTLIFQGPPCWCRIRENILFSLCVLRGLAFARPGTHAALSGVLICMILLHPPTSTSFCLAGAAQMQRSPVLHTNVMFPFCGNWLRAQHRQLTANLRCAFNGPALVHESWAASFPRCPSPPAACCVLLGGLLEALRDAAWRRRQRDAAGRSFQVMWFLCMSHCRSTRYLDRAFLRV